MESIEEGDVGQSATQEGDRALLSGFQSLKVKIHMLAEKDLTTLSTKRKFQGLFDVGVFSVYSADKISPEVTRMFKDKARVHQETGDFLITLKPE